MNCMISAVTLLESPNVLYFNGSCFDGETHITHAASFRWHVIQHKPIGSRLDACWISVRPTVKT